MDATYRESTEALRAEVTRLEGEVARLSEKRPMRWEVDSDGMGRGGWSDGACCCAVLWVLAAIGAAIPWVLFGDDPRVLRGLCLVGGSAILWALAFVRRVPA